MSARDELAGILWTEELADWRLGPEEAADAILAAGYSKAPLTEIQEQVNHMYAAAKQGENMFGENTASDHLRHFADKIGALVTQEPAA